MSALPTIALKTVETVDQTLQIEYSISNHLTETIFVTTALPSFDIETMRGVVYLDRSYISHDGDESVVLFLGPVLAADHDSSAYTPRRPFSIPVSPGGVHQGVLREPLPFREWHGHAPLMPGIPFERHSITTGVLVVSYVPRSLLSDAPIEVPTRPGLVIASGLSQRLAVTFSLPQPCAVDRRLDSYNRYLASSGAQGNL